MSDKGMDAGFSSDLDAWLAATDRSQMTPADRYVVDRTLKETPYETTEVVYRRNSQGRATVGPFVRKRFVEDVGRGQAYERILQAQAAGIRLEHQPLIYECERSGDSVDVVMECLQGMTLDMLAQREAPSIDLAARVMPQLCDALTELHESFEQPLIHRDVKPSNVMLCGECVKLIDLGIARAYRTDADRDTVRYGTPGYAPPEQYGFGQTSVRSDVYALGMTMAFCLTGQDPTTELRESGFSDPRIPPTCAEVLIHATQFDPANRYASVRDLRRAIDAALRTERGAAPLPSAAPAPDKSQASKANRIATVLEALGRIWNALIVVVWVLMTTSVIANIIEPRGNNVQYPRWFNALLFLGLLHIPWTLLSYLLMDKRRLRKRAPFDRWTWRKELPVCLGIIVVCGIVVIVLYNAFFGKK